MTSSTSGTTTTFTITRSSSATAETVYYRTVSLTAYAEFHFQAKSGTLTFAAGETSKSVSIQELTPTVVAFKYQVGATRSYRFEVTDWGGTSLAYCDRTLTTGTSVATTAFDVKDIIVNSGTITVTDAGYEQAFHADRPRGGGISVISSHFPRNRNKFRGFLFPFRTFSPR